MRFWEVNEGGYSPCFQIQEERKYHLNLNRRIEKIRNISHRGMCKGPCSKGLWDEVIEKLEYTAVGGEKQPHLHSKYWCDRKEDVWCGQNTNVIVKNKTKTTHLRQNRNHKFRVSRQFFFFKDKPSSAPACYKHSIKSHFNLTDLGVKNECTVLYKMWSFRG